MTQEYIIHDTAEVIVTDVTDGSIVLMGNTTTAGISQSITEEDIKAGIGNGVIYTLRTDKVIEINVTSATFTKETLAMTQGVSVDAAGTIQVTKSGYLSVEEDSVTGDLIVDLTKLGEGHVPSVITALTQAKVEKDTVAVTSGIAILPVGSGHALGDKVAVYYTEDVVGNSIKLDADKFSHKYKVELRTIAYDLDTATVGADVFIVFPETIPSGEFELNFSAGEPITPEIKFKALTPKGSKTMGTFIEVPR